MDIIDQPFTFNILNNKFSGFESKTTKTYLQKWSLADGLKVQAFSFDKPFKNYLKDKFVQDFFADYNVVGAIPKWTNQKGRSISSEVIKFEEVKCTQTDLTLLSRLENDLRICRKDGSICKWYPEYFDNEIEIADELRKLLLKDEDSKSFDIYSKEEKSEFIFQLFKHFVIGGSLCQYEDFIKPYLDTTKAIYKDLITVVRKKEVEDKIEVTSQIIKILGAKNENYNCEEIFFRKNHLNNFLYLIISPFEQKCITFYHHI